MRVTTTHEWKTCRKSGTAGIWTCDLQIDPETVSVIAELSRRTSIDNSRSCTRWWHFLVQSLQRMLIKGQVAMTKIPKNFSGCNTYRREYLVTLIFILRPIWRLVVTLRSERRRKVKQTGTPMLQCVMLMADRVTPHNDTRAEVLTWCFRVFLWQNSLNFSSSG